jgi:LmbE family N-acetylglucosaminyl deacetylase
LGSILSVWAHPDDETYLSAGVMARAVDRGDRVVCVSASAGELGTPDPVEWPAERLGRRRRWEAAAAMAVLGVVDHRFLDLPDGSLGEHELMGIERIGALIDEVRPDTIVTFGSDGITFHPDHIAVSRWVTAAWETRGRPCRLLYATSTPEHLARFRESYEQLGMYMTDERPVGVPRHELAVHLRLEGWQLDRKLTALAAMASQTGPAIAAVGYGDYVAEIAEESFVDARVRLHDVVRGLDSAAV